MSLRSPSVCNSHALLKVVLQNSQCLSTSEASGSLRSAVGIISEPRPLAKPPNALHTPSHRPQCVVKQSSAASADVWRDNLNSLTW